MFDISSPFKGIFLMVIATLLFSIMHASIKYISSDIHPFEVAFFRNLFGLIIIAPWFFKYGLKPLKTKKLKLHMIRAIFNVIAMLAFFFALSITPLAEVASLGFTAPLFATLLAIIFLKEKIGIRRTTAVIIGFIGAAIIVDPDFETVDFGHLCVLLSACVWSVALIFIKILGRTESSVTITSYMIIFMIPLSGVIASFYWSIPSIYDLLVLVLIGTTGTAAQMLLAEALKEEDTGLIMPFDFLKLVWAVLIGFLIFTETPEINTWVGSIIIFCSTIYVAYRERKVSKASSKSVSSSLTH